MLMKVEHGIESSYQLFLQIWVLAPYYSILSQQKYLDLVQQAVRGLWSFLPGQDGDLIDISVGRLIQGMIMLTIGETLVKLAKHNITMEKKMAVSLPLFLSILFLTVIRMLSI